jgi:hypothetical protein
MLGRLCYEEVVKFGGLLKCGSFEIIVGLAGWGRGGARSRNMTSVEGYVELGYKPNTCSGKEKTTKILFECHVK